MEVVKEELLRQIDVNNEEILKLKQQLEEADFGRKLLLQKSNGLEEKLNELQCTLSRSSTVAGKDSYECLLQKIQLKDSQLQSLKEKTKQTSGAYKILKSQYNFLCNKFGLPEENMLLQIKLEDESISLTHHQNPETASASCKIKKVKIENEVKDGAEGNQAAKLIPVSSFRSPSSSHKAKSVPVIGTKRRAS